MQADISLGKEKKTRRYRDVSVYFLSIYMFLVALYVLIIT